LRTVQRFGVDFKVDASVLPNQIDHAALPQKGVIFTHQKQAGLRQAFYIGQSTLFFGRAKENDTGVLFGVDTCDHHRAGCDDFAGDDGVQHIKKIVIRATHSDHER